MKVRHILIISLLASALAVCSCGHDDGPTGPNTPPVTVITKAPPQGSVQPYQVEIAWLGTDSDGRVTSYEIAWHSGGFDSTVIADLDWEATTVTESTFTLLADSCCVGSDSTQMRHTHTFFVRAVDNRSESDPEPPHRSFTAKTTVPFSTITSPLPSSQPSCVTFRWTGTDDDGEVVAYRYVWKPYYAFPESLPYQQDDPRWSDWTSDTELTIRILDGAALNPWSFYLQAKDNAGATETSFRTVENRNHLIFSIDESKDSYPWIKISCYSGGCFDQNKQFLGSRSTTDSLAMEIPIAVSVGDTLCFKIEFRKGTYASRATHIRIQLDDPDPSIWWDPIPVGQTEYLYPPLGSVLIADAGPTALYVWVKDDYCVFGSERRAYIKVEAS